MNKNTFECVNHDEERNLHYSEKKCSDGSPTQGDKFL